MELMKLLRGAARGADARSSMADAGLLAARARRRAAISRRFENMAKVEAAAGAAADPVRRLGALGVAVAEDAERLWQRLRLSNAEHERLASMARGLVAHFAGGRRAGGARAALSARAASVSPIACCWPGRARRRPRTTQAWRALATLPQRWTAPVFPLKAADFIARGVEKGPALGAALRAAEEAWIAAGFPGEAAALDAIV